jgi:hypothetical protein
VNCKSPHTIHTIGHSTRTISAIVELLKAHDIEMVVDVRRWPASRRLRHFNRESLTTDLKTEGIEYIWRGDLGGFRKPAPDSPNSAWRVGAFRAYADFMLTPEFQTIMNEMEELAATRRIALLWPRPCPGAVIASCLPMHFLRENGQSVTSWITVVMSTSCRRLLN